MRMGFFSLSLSKLINFEYYHKVAASVFKMVGIVARCGALT